MKTYRIEELRKYLINCIKQLTEDNDYFINIDFLDNDENMYSINKIPTEPIVETWITGQTIKQDVYDFYSKKNYSSDLIENLDNIGFFEKFEKLIEDNNKNKIYPNINGIEKIECLNCGGLSTALPNQAIFSIQIRIQYMEGK